jgi:hypothetical protein
MTFNEKNYNSLINYKKWLLTLTFRDIILLRGDSMGNIGEDKQQISVTLPKYIVELLEKDAKKEVRKRGQQAAKIIIDHYENNDCQK